MAPSFISPPLLFAWICCWGIFISNLHPPSAIHGKFNKNRRTLQLRRMRRRLELTPYHPTYWSAIHRPSDWLHSSGLVASWWWCKNCITFSDHTHSAPSLIISWSFALQNWATTSFITSHTRQWQTILPLLFSSPTPQRGKGAYKWDYFIILAANVIGKRRGHNVNWIRYNNTGKKKSGE